MPLKYFLPLYLFAYFCAAFFWRSFMVWKRTGVNPIVFKGSDDAHDFIGRIFKLLFALIVGVVLVYSFWSSVYVYLMPIDWLEHSWLRLTGIVLLLLSLVWTVLAQPQMRILAYRRRPNASHKLSAERSLQPFPKSDLPWDDAYAVRAFSCDPKCFDAAYPWARCRADSDSSAARSGIPCHNAW